MCKTCTTRICIFSPCADVLLDMVDITAVLCKSMKERKVDETGMKQQIQFMSLREEELKSRFKMKRIRMIGRSPRLKSELADIKKEVRLAVDMDEVDSLGRVFKFPNVFSLHMKQLSARRGRQLGNSCTI